MVTLLVVVIVYECREDLLGPSNRSVEEINRIAGLDNTGIVGLQRQIMKGIYVVFLLISFNDEVDI